MVVVSYNDDFYGARRSLQIGFCGAEESADGYANVTVGKWESGY